MVATVDELFENYLSRVEAATRDLPPGQRTELLANLKDHLDEARLAGHAADIDSAAKVLSRLGSPDEIVDSAKETAAPRNRSMSPRTKVFLALTVGSFVPVIGWVWGVSRVWSSNSWSRREKWIALLAFPGGPLAALLTSVWIASLTAITCGSGVFGRVDPSSMTAIGSTPIARTCSEPALTPWVGFVFIILILAASIVGPLIVSRNFRMTEPR